VKSWKKNQIGNLKFEMKQTIGSNNSYQELKLEMFLPGFLTIWIYLLKEKVDLASLLKRMIVLILMNRVFIKLWQMFKFQGFRNIFTSARTL